MIEHHLDQDGKLDAWDRLLREAALVRPFLETVIEWARLDNGVLPRPVEVYLRRWEGGMPLTLILGLSDASASGYFFRRI